MGRAIALSRVIILGHLVVRMSRYHNGMDYALSIGVAIVANKKALFVTLVDPVPEFDVPVSCRIRLICCAYELLRYLHLEMWRFLC